MKKLVQYYLEPFRPSLQWVTLKENSYVSFEQFTATARAAEIEKNFSLFKNYAYQSSNDVKRPH